MIRPEVERIMRNVVESRKRNPDNKMLLHFEEVVTYLLYLEAQPNTEAKRD